MTQQIYNSVKEYPDMIKVRLFRQPIIVPKASKKRKVRKSDETPIISDSSVRRTRQTIEDLCVCNQFDWFCTFTFDPKRVDSFNINKCRILMNHWTRNAKQRHSPDLKYLIVPELHESGRIHFHALLRGFNGQIKDAHLSQNGRDVYNIKNWRFGFSTAVKIDNIVAVSRYIRKYITKDMIIFSGKKRFFCSQNLVRPTKSSNKNVDWLDGVPSDKVQFYADRDSEFYMVRKYDIPFDPKTSSQPKLF